MLIMPDFAAHLRLLGLTEALVFLPDRGRFFKPGWGGLRFELAVDDTLSPAHPHSGLMLLGSYPRAHTVNNSSRFGPGTGGDADAAVGACLLPNAEAGFGLDGPLAHSPHDPLVAVRDSAAGTGFRADLAVPAKLVNPYVHGRVVG